MTRAEEQGSSGTPGAGEPPWIVIPVRAVDDGKRRLASILDPGTRARLVAWFLEHTLTVALSLGSRVRVRVVTADPEAARIARGAGAGVLREPAPGGHNAALAHAAREAGRAGAPGLLALSIDLPWLARADLQAILDPEGARDGEAPGEGEETNAIIEAPERETGGERAARVHIAPDRHGLGTNALYLEPPEIIAPRFGPGSFARHRDAALAAGALLRVVDRPGLRFDIDTPEDWGLYREAERRRRS